MAHESVRRGVTDDEIVIAGASGLTSTEGGYPGADVGAWARFARANAKGGIHGRHIRYLLGVDDAEDPNRNFEEVRRLVERVGVFAIVPQIGRGLQSQSSNFLDRARVPFVGWGFNPGYHTSRLGFGFNGYLLASDAPNPAFAGTLVKALDLPRVTTVAVQSWKGEGGIKGARQIAAAFAAYGLDVVFVDASLDETRPVDLAERARILATAAGGRAPDVIAMSFRFENTVGVTRALRERGYSGTMMNYITYAPGLLDSQPETAEALEGSYVNTQILPEEFGGPAIEQLQRDLLVVGGESTMSLGSAMGYWCADLFVQMLEAARRQLDAQRLEAVVNDGWSYVPDFEPPGIGPVRFPDGHDRAAPNAALVRIECGRYVPVMPMTHFADDPVR
jgi:ABC-type branched-subunit amino acid transport system substrate-binding protein